MSARTTRSRRRLTRALATGISITLITAGAVVLAGATGAQAAVVKSFTQDYAGQVYGDFLEVGSSSVTCPDATTVDPTRDADGEPANTVATCAVAQQRGDTTYGDESYRMIWANPGAGILNSSQAALTIPPGATVAFARLNWSAPTGYLENADATGQVAFPSCGTGDTADNPAVLPGSAYGSYASNAITLIANGQTATYAPGSSLQVDPVASLPANAAQDYSAYADVTAQLAGATTGTAIPITVQNLWGPSGFSCYGGWSLTVVYSYPTPNATYAPFERQVSVYNGHDRQQNGDPTTTVSIPDLHLASSDTHIGVTAYGGDYNVTGDQLLINGTPAADPLTAGNASPTTDNFFVGDAEGNGTFSNGAAGGTFTAGPPNVFSVDAKTVDTTLIAPDGTAPSTATVGFTTSGDDFLAQELVLSSVLPEIRVAVAATTTTARAGGTASYTITVTNPTASPLSDVAVTDAAVSDCDDPDIGALAGNATDTYTCTGTVPDNGSTSFTNTVSASGDDYTGSPVTATGSADPVTVIHPSIGITATADQSLYTAGQPVTYSVTVTNTGDATLTDTAVSDTNIASCADTVGTLAAGASSTYTCGTTAPVAGGGTRVMVVGTDPTGGTVDASASASSPTAGTVSGTVFADANDDGTIDGTDTGIPGVTLTLTPTSGAATTTTTGPDGGFSFPTVAPGTYTLTETQPAGYAQGKDTPGTGATATAQDVDTVTVGDDGASSGNLFGEVPSDSLAGVVYLDSNDNGVKAAGEPGIAGVTIDLSGTDDGGNAVSASTQTLAGGSYAFPALRPGTYTLTELQPQGYVQGKDSAGTPAGDIATQDTISAITLSGMNTAGTGYDFGELLAASLAGQVATAAGTPLNGVTVTLTGTDDNDAAVSTQTTTSATGAYVFTGLRPGNYTVESQPAAYLPGLATAGSKGGMVSGTDEVTAIGLASGDSATGYNFVETAATLSGTVFSDLANDGTQGTGDPGIGGVTVTLTGTGADGRAISASTQTLTGGTFSFTDLPAGTAYTVTETPPSGYLAGITTAGTGGGMVSGDTVSGVTVMAGTAATGYTFAEVPPASVGGVVTDQHGTPEVGVTVTLGGAAAMSTTTASDGSYGFDDLYPGTYTVTETQPVGLGDGTDTVGSVDGSTDGTATTVNAIGGIALSGGGVGTGYDFTDTSGSIAGRVFVDANGDGVFDTGDTGIGAVVVTATDGTQTLSARTGTDGTYTITGLPAGTWTVTETPPTGYGAGVSTVGTVNGTPSGTSTSADTVSGVVVPAGGAGTGYSFSHTTATISGTVFLDANGDGIQDGTEHGLSAVTITLKRGTTVIGTRSTATDGSWSFGGLLAGIYTVVETQPAGYSSGTDTVGRAGGTDDGNGTSFSAIPLAAGATASGYTFAEYVGSSLSGTVTDSAGNPLPGVTVTVSGGGLTNPVAANTGTAGGWSVPNLAPGSYTVTETQPAGYGNGTVTAGTDGGDPSTDGNSVTGVTVTSGSSGAGTGPAFVDAAATLSGTVFVDANGDGVQDGSEQGLGGVALTLTNTTTGHTYSVTTANGTNGTLGSWSDAALPAGTYTIVETEPVGYASGTDTPGTPANGTAASDGVTISGISIAAGSTNVGYTFAEYVSSTVTGTVKTDGGTALGDVTVTATDASGLSYTATTDVTGSYTLTLPPGTYALAESQPTGYGDGSATLGSGVGGNVTGPNSFGGLQVTSGSSGSGYSFTDTTSGLSGTVFADLNNDGVQDGQEQGIAGVTVTVRSGTASGTVVGTLTTDANGDWSVSGLLAGTYTVTETQPAGYGAGTATPGSAAGTVSPDGNTITVSLPAGTAGTGYDFADTLGAISGTVFLDANDNGVQDPGDTPIAGVTVTVLAGSTVAGTATTATDGSWAVTGLLAGTYTVRETQPADYANGTDTAGLGGGMLVPPDTFTGVTVTAGVDEDGYTFAETVGAITGVVALDNDRDGVYTPGVDRPEGGVTVTLYDGTGAVVATTSTAADGTYAFTGLPPDTYTVVETQPPGFGSDTSNAQSLTLDGGGATEFFGDIGATIGGTVWRDANRDGVRDDGEPAAGHTALVLRNAAGKVIATATSASDGSYAFTDLPAGTYTVAVRLPTGDVVTTEYRATTAQTGSAFSPVTATTAPIDITVDATTGVISNDLAADVGLATAYADITVAANGPSRPVAVGAPATSTITVVNDGNETQPGATVTMVVPAGQAPTTVGGSTFTCSATPTTAAGTTTITCRTTSPIDPGASAPPITLITEPTGPGTSSIAVSVAALVRDRDASATNDDAAIVIAGVGAAIGAGGEDDGTVNGALPYTGLDIGGLISLALLCLSAGMVLLAGGRRQRWTWQRAGLPRTRPTRARSRWAQALAAVRRAATSSQLMMFHSAET